MTAARPCWSGGAAAGTGSTAVTTVAVVAHRRKLLGGGLDALRRLLSAHGVDEPLWYEVTKSRQATKRVRQALEEGADLVFAWGGDGTVQRCADALAGSGAALAVLPAGTANLFAVNLGIPRDLEQAVSVGLHGDRRPIDVGVVNGERFVVMAGTGLDALMIRDTDGGVKRRLGRAAYVWTAVRHVRAATVDVRVEVDGEPWFDGPAGCVLVGNVSHVFGGIAVFDDARPDDGVLDVGVVAATGLLAWARVMGRVVTGRSDRSPLVRVGQGRSIDVRLASRRPYQLDGGDRPATKRLRVGIEPGALTVCVPAGGERRSGR